MPGTSLLFSGMTKIKLRNGDGLHFPLIESKKLVVKALFASDQSFSSFHGHLPEDS